MESRHPMERVTIKREGETKSIKGGVVSRLEDTKA